MFCAGVKEFLSQRGVEFVDQDITEDEQTLAELGELGYMTTPVTVIDGEVVIGFDRERLEQLLANK
jgi:glutaredoxin 3